jgi:hypothetical protein
MAGDQTGISEATESAASIAPRKTIRGGHVVIEKDGKMYNVMGVRGGR